MSSGSPAPRIAAWVLVLVFPALGAAGVIAVVAATTTGPAAVAFAVPFALGSAAVWASGLQQLVLVVAASRRARAPRTVPPGPIDAGRYAIVLCTADDFDPRRALSCAAQDVPAELVVLDDSATPQGRARVDAFAAQHPVRVIRRGDRSGFKGGNLTHALDVLGDDYDSWLLVDSDQSLPADALRRLRAHRAPGVAIVQGRPAPRLAATPFGALLGALPGTHLAIAQAGRPDPWFLGRVALIEVAALRAVGGVPSRVVEDVALTAALRTAGYRIVDAPEVVGLEDAPLDLRAFRVQQLKFLDGAVELLHRDGWRILRAGFPLAERLELVLSHLLVVAAVAGGALALTAGAALAALGAFPAGAGLVTALAAFAPLLGELLRLVREGRVLAAVGAAVALPALYGALGVAAIARLARLAVGAPARFRVTPKHADAASLLGTVGALRGELAVAVIALALAASAGLPALAVPFTTPFVLGLGFARLGRSAAPRSAPQRTVASSSPSASRMRTASPGVVSAAARMMPPVAPRTTA